MLIHSKDAIFVFSNVKCCKIKQETNTTNNQELKKKNKIPSLASTCRAELEDLSLLEGIELAARELVACSCISLILPKYRGKKKKSRNFYRER